MTAQEVNTVRDALQLIQECGTILKTNPQKLKRITFINGSTRVDVRAKRGRKWQDTWMDALVKAVELDILDWKVKSLDGKIIQPFWSKHFNHQWEITAFPRPGV